MSKLPVLSLGIACVLALGGIATAATAVTPSPESPLVHLRDTTTLCRATFPNVPGVRHVCLDLAFSEDDVWIYRDGKGLAVIGEQHSTLPPSPPGTLPVSQVRQGKVPAATFTAINNAFAIVTGGCTPFSTQPSLPELPVPDFHYQITWYGKDFRHNVLILGSEFPDPCPQNLTDLVNTLLGVSGALVP